MINICDIILIMKKIRIIAELGMSDRERKNMKSSKAPSFVKISLLCAALMLACVTLCSCGVFGGDTEYAVKSENNTSSDGFIYSLYENNTAIITGCKDSTASYLTVPSTVDGYRVVEIGEGAFKARETLKHVIISEGIKKLSSGAFASCDALVCVDLPSTLKEIGDSAFESCTTLCEVINTSGLVSIGDGAFEFCEYLSSFEFSENLEYIGESAFYGCSRLSKAVLPSGIKTVGTGAFSSCTSLVYANLGGLTEISDSLFEKCEVLVKVDMSNKVTSVGTRAFRGCTLLSEIQPSKRIKSVGAAAFDGTAWVEASTEEFLVVGDGILLRYTGSASDVTIPKNVKSIADAFAGSETLRNITIGSNITEISEYAFSGCKVLSSVTVKGKLKRIADGAFYGCTSLTSVTLPKTLEAVGDGAFENCPSLDKVVFGGSESAWKKLAMGKDNAALTGANISFK